MYIYWRTQYLTVLFLALVKETKDQLIFCD